MRTGILAAMAATLFLGVAAACSNGGSGSPSPSPGASPSPAATATPPASPAAEPSATPTPRPAVTAPVRHDYRSPAKVDVQDGILLADPRTGEVIVWELPAPVVRPISDDGHWAVYGRPDGKWAVYGRSDSQHLLDTATGTDRALVLDGEPLIALGFSPGTGERMAAVSASRFLLLETATLAVLKELQIPDGMVPRSEPEFTGDGRRVAQSFQPEGTNGVPGVLLVLELDGPGRVLNQLSWPMAWSPDGKDLAATARLGMVIAGQGFAEMAIPFRGWNPRWSRDGRYLAVANDYDVGGARVFEVASGREVLRYQGMPTCLGDYWRPDGTLVFGEPRNGAWQSLALALDGTTAPFDFIQHPEREFGYEFAFVSQDPAIRARTADGREFELVVDSMWSAYYDNEGVRWVLDDGRILLLLGVGGKGLCDGVQQPPAFQLPPFVADRVLPTFPTSRIEGLTCDVRGRLEVHIAADGGVTGTIPSEVSPPMVFGPLPLFWPEGTHLRATDGGFELRDWRGAVIARDGSARTNVRICWEGSTAFIVDPGQEAP